jgi:hypothetical protein
MTPRGRRNCARCGLWRYYIDFYPYNPSACRRCEQARYRARHEPRYDHWLPAEPLQEWIEQKRLEYGSMARLSEVCEVHPRKLSRMFTQRFVQLAPTDRLLTKEGSSLNDLYPVP